MAERTNGFNSKEKLHNHSLERILQAADQFPGVKARVKILEGRWRIVAVLSLALWGSLVAYIFDQLP